MTQLRKNVTGSIFIYLNHFIARKILTIFHTFHSLFHRFQNGAKRRVKKDGGEEKNTMKLC